MAETKNSPRAIALLVFVVLSAAFGLYAYLTGWIRPDLIREAVADSGSFGMVAYVAAVVVLEVLWVPRAWGLFAGGALFGTITGGLLSLVADMIGAILCYGLARGGGRQWVKNMLEKRPKAAKVIELLAHRRGLMTIAVLRVAPFAHYTSVSYAAGVCGVAFLPFVVGNAIGILPGALLYPYIGHNAADPTSPQFLISVAILVVALIVSVVLSRRFLRNQNKGEE